MIVVHAGNRVDEPGRMPPRFPPGCERRVRERFDALLGLVAPEGIVTSAAAGADLLLVESAIDRSVPVHLVLPFGAERFRDESVADRGERWVRSYDDAIDAVSEDGRGSLLILDFQPDDGGFRAANRALVERACSLAGRVLAVAVRSRGGDEPPSLTDDFVHQAAAAGLFVIEIDAMAS